MFNETSSERMVSSRGLLDLRQLGQRNLTSRSDVGLAPTVDLPPSPDAPEDVCSRIKWTEFDFGAVFYCKLVEGAQDFLDF